MKTIVAITFALTLMCGAAFAQNTGAPAAAQTDPVKPGTGTPAQKRPGHFFSGEGGPGLSLDHVASDRCNINQVDSADNDAKHDARFGLESIRI